MFGSRHSNEMAPEAVHERREGLQILDVRDPYEWSAGRIEGAVHVPMREVPQRLETLDRSRPLIAVCRSGARSHRVTHFLRANGFEAYNLSGGMKAWARARLPFSAPDGRPGRVV